MSTYILLSISILLTSCITCYGLILTGFTLKGVLYKKKFYNSNPSVLQQVPISIMIASHHEGIGLLAAIESIEKQNYQGIKDIYVLFKNLEDTSLAFLEKKYGQKITHSCYFSLKNNTQLHVVFCKKSAKKDKINQLLPQLKTLYTAIVDADHRMQKEWLLKSVGFLQKNKTYACVQGARAPLSVQNLFQLWDSVQNHIGNEFFNASLQRFQISCFFTGTTAVFHTAVLQKIGFSNCLTEDTFLSYQMRLQQHTIGYIPWGSLEEVAPDIQSYIARRRRWSHGHNHTFFSHCIALLKSTLPAKEKRLLFFHGLFYFIPVWSVLLLNLWGVFQFLQYAKIVQLWLVLGSILASILLTAYTQKRKITQDILLSFLWVFPQIIFLSTWLLFLFQKDSYVLLVSFPWMETLDILYLGLLFLPLCWLFLAMRKLGNFSLSKILLLLVSYPFFLFLDLYAVFLGFCDYLLGNTHWRRITRTFQDDSQNLQSPFVKRISKKVWGIFGVLIAATGSIYFLMPQPCQQIAWKNHIHTTPIEASKEIEVVFSGSMNSHKGEYLIVVLDSYCLKIPLSPFSKTRDFATKQYHFAKRYPMGFAQKKVQLFTKDARCVKTHRFTTTAKEIKEHQLYINGSPFLIKGMVASFHPSKSNLSTYENLSQIKALGVNLIRFYHEPSQNMLEMLQEQQLFVLPQTDGTNWGHTDLNKVWNRKKLLSKHQALQEELYANPFVGMISFGNEMELKNHKDIPTIEDLLQQAKQAAPRNFISYSTYLTYINYPADILGINMLDTGQTYWEKALAMLRSYQKPILASELGGFNAFYETPDPFLRAYRLHRQWEALLKHDVLGGIVFQSHDNWAQPIPGGINDPFSDDHPDDTRGIYTQDNTPKPIASVVAELFADIAVTFDLKNSSVGETLVMTLENKREYALQDIRFKDGETLLTIPVLSLPPKAQKTILIDSHTLTNASFITVTYTTHQGLTAFTKIALPTANSPFLTSSLGFLEKIHQDLYTATPLTNSLEGYLPKGWSIDSGGMPLVKNQQQFAVKNTHPEEFPYLLEVFDSQTQKWRSWDFLQTHPQKDVFVRFAFKNPVEDNALLILEGLGASRIALYTDTDKQVKKIKTHPYKENVLSFTDYLPKDFTGLIYLKFTRNHTRYLAAEHAPNGGAIVIDLQKPRKFSPKSIFFHRKKVPF